MTATTTGTCQILLEDTDLAEAVPVAERAADPGWVLGGEPPGELLELQTVSPRGG